MFLLTLVERSTCTYFSQLLSFNLKYEPDRLQSGWTQDGRWHHRTYSKILNTCVVVSVRHSKTCQSWDLPWLKSASPVKPSWADIELESWKFSWYVLQEKCSYDVNLQQWRSAAYHAITPPRQLFLARILWKRPLVEIRYHFVLRFTFVFTNNIAQKS